MSFPEDVHAVSRGLAFLIVSGRSSSLAEADLPIALAGRREVILLCREVLATATDRASPSLAGVSSGALMTFRAVLRDPVGSMAALLDGLPVPTTGAALTDLVLRAAPDDRWAEVAKHGLAAAHTWQSSAPALTPAQQWAAVADVSALVQSVVLLDGQLAQAPAARHEPLLRDALHRSQLHGLDTSAREAQHLAQAGPIADWRLAPEPIATRLLIRPVRTADDVAPALHRLAVLIDAAQHLSPQSVSRLAAGQARLLDGYRQLRDDRRGPVRDMRRSLGLAARGSRLLATRTPTDPRPLLQHREVLRAVPGDGSGARVPWRADYAPGVAAVVAALDRSVSRAARKGTWMAVDSDALTGPAWRPLTVVERQPPLVESVRDAAAAAHVLLDEASVPVAARPAVLVRPSVELAGALRLGDADLRPVTPRGQRSGAPTPSRRKNR